MPVLTFFHHGTVLTMDSRRPRAEAVVVRDGRVTAVGSEDDLAHLLTAKTRRVDLQGGTLLPGFNDAHVHIWKVGHLLTTMADLRGHRTIEALQRTLAEKSANLAPDAWVQGRGYNEALLEEGRHPNRRDLDAVLPDRPVVLIRTCAHMAVANSRALELAGIGPLTEPPPGGAIDRGAGGEPTGLLRETAMGLVLRHVPQPTRAELEHMIRAGCRHLMQFGVTSATDPAVMPELLNAYRALDERGKLPMRVNLLAIRRPDAGTETLPLPDKLETTRLRIDSVKFFADGGLSGATAALSVPYRDTDSTGILRFTEDELFELALEAHRAGLRIGTHAIGDRAIEQVLTVYERLALTCPGPRHRIEHFGLPTDEHLRRAARQRILIATQPIFLRALGMNFRRYLPRAFDGRRYPFKAMMDAGLDVAFSTDGPVVRDLNPLAGIQAAIRRCDEGGALDPDQAITAEQALRAYTLGGAIASGDDGNRGTIAPGKWADFVLLGANPLQRDPRHIAEIPVWATFLKGKRIHTG